MTNITIQLDSLIMPKKPSNVRCIAG